MRPIDRQINQLPYPLDRILHAARGLLEKGSGGDSTSERVAAAFVLERMEYLPSGWGVIEAWERLDIEWQFYVKHLRKDCRHLIEALETGAASREGW